MTHHAQFLNHCWATCNAITYQLLKFSWPIQGTGTQTDAAIFERLRSLRNTIAFKKIVLRKRHAYHMETPWDGNVSIYEKGSSYFTITA